MTEYAPLGFIGVLTPQANTTVEPELSILCPPGVGLLTARLVSSKSSMDDRLVDYVQSMEATLSRFANAPLKAVIFACTGAAYLVDPDDENEKLRIIQQRYGYPLITAANAIHEAVTILGAHRVGIMSPYGDPLHERALSYWQKRGLEIADVHRIDAKSGAFHPIYAQSAATSKAGLTSLHKSAQQATLILGTGLPTLPTLRNAKGLPVPVLSPNLCLMWRAMQSISGTKPALENLMPWVTGETWSARFLARMQPIS